MGGGANLPSGMRAFWEDLPETEGLIFGNSEFPETVILETIKLLLSGIIGFCTDGRENFSKIGRSHFEGTEGVKT